MEDYLWRCLDSSNTLHITRDQIELAIQKKKISDVFNWFNEHFVTSSHAEYLQRCPILILQGPTGCGKTITLRWISNELKIPIKEYSETTDLTAINFYLSKSFKNDPMCSNGDEDNQKNFSQSIDRKKSMKFEHFVINSLRYSTLYPATKNIPALATDSFNTNNSNSSIPYADSDAEDEFDAEEELFLNCCLKATNRIQKPPPLTGVIIHIETPLSFARYQRILIQTLYNLIKKIREILSKNPLRRIAIVFETLEADGETLTLPTKMKLSLGIQTIKFNPVTKANMKKLIEHIVKPYSNIIIDKDSMEQLLNDCDGDVRACLNTLQLICNKSTSCIGNVAVPMGILNQQNGTNNQYNYHSNSNDKYSDFIHKTSPYYHQQNQANKKIKLGHNDTKNSKIIKLTPNLLRDNTRSINFFHVLGKIFYQKRLYPEHHPNNNYGSRYSTITSIVERPYPLADSIEDIANMLDMEAKNLLTWLHQHFHKFCSNQNIDKAALFLENQSMVDTTSLNSTQSTQFYEMHTSLDKLQLYLAINSTIFSLYEDQSKSAPKSSHKKKLTENGYKWIKSSVESSSCSGKADELFSFKKPSVISLDKVASDNHNLLEICASRLFNLNLLRADPTKLLVDYIPYLDYMSGNWSKMAINKQEEFKSSITPSRLLFEDEGLLNLYKTLDRFDTNTDIDYDSKHDQLLELIDWFEKHDTETTINGLS